MMGRSHAAMGLAAGAGIGLAVYGSNSSTWLIPAVAMCGAALLPDIDEPGSSVSREFGFVSQGFSYMVNKIAGGHRKLTHSLLGLAIVMVLLAFSAAAREGSAILFGLLAAGAWRIVIPWWFGLRHLFPLAGAGGAWYFYHSHPFGGLWLVALVGAGWAVHMLGDYLTKGGIPLLYPRTRMLSLPVFGATGSGLETAFAVLLYLAAALWAGLWFSHYSQLVPISRILPVGITRWW